MSYDTFNFDQKKILKHCSTRKSNDLKIEYLKNVLIDYQNYLVAKGQTSIYCETEDVFRPECGANEPFINWIRNEIKRYEIKKNKYVRLTARLDKIDPKVIYSIPAIAILVARHPRTIKNWIIGISLGNKNKLNLKVTMHAGKPCIRGQDMLNFLQDWNIAKEQ